MSWPKPIHWWFIAAVGLIVLASIMAAIGAPGAAVGIPAAAGAFMLVPGGIFAVLND